MRSNDMKDDEILRQYLLGALGEEQADIVEERLLRDGDFFELAEAVEGDLLAAAARRELSPATRGRVLRRLAGSPEGRSRYALAVGLTSITPEPVPTKVLLFRLLARPEVRAAMAASLLFVMGGLWLGTQTLTPGPKTGATIVGAVSTDTETPAPPEPSSPSVRPEELAELPHPPAVPAAEEKRLPRQEIAAPPEPDPWIFPLALAFTTRSAGEESDLPEMDPPDTGRVEIHLSLEGEPSTSFVASLRNVSTRNGLRREERLTAQEVDGRKVIILSVPAADLVPGTYEVEVRGVTEEVGLVGTSTFEVASN